MDKVQNLIDEKKSKCDNNDKSKHIDYVQFLENKIKTKYGRKEKITTLLYIYIYIYAKYKEIIIKIVIIIKSKNDTVGYKIITFTFTYIYLVLRKQNLLALHSTCIISFCFYQ